MYRLAVIILLATTVVVAHMPRVATRKKNKDRDEDRLLQQDEESGLRGSNPVYDGQNRRLVGEDDEDDNFDDAAFSADADDERRAASLSSTLGDFDDLAVLLASTIGAGITSTKVAIGGAGAAGVGAATTLDANNVDFIIFEAANRVGGRVFPFRFGKEGRRVTNEAGAQWISGLTGAVSGLDNPLFGLKNEANLKGVLQNFRFDFYNKNGKRDLDEENFEDGSFCGDMDRAYNKGEKLSLKCIQPGSNDVPLPAVDQKFCNRKLGKGFVPVDGDDYSVADVYDIVTEWDPSQYNSEKKRASARVCESFYFDWEYGDSTAVTSAALYVPLFTYSDFSDEDFIVADRRGYSFLLKTMLATILGTSKNTERRIVFDDEKLQLKTKIVKVFWDDQGIGNVTLLVCNTRKKKPDNNDVQFPCKKGIGNYGLVNATHFLSTFSVGVLQKTLELEEGNVPLFDSIDIAPRFDPPLSNFPAFAEQIRSNALGVYTKVFLQFDDRFWNRTEYFISAASDGGDFIGNFAPHWGNFDRNDLYRKSGVLVLYTTGDRARDLAKKTDDEALGEILPILSKIFRDEIRDMYGRPNLKPKDVLDLQLVRWSENPLFYGSFTNSPVGFSLDKTLQRKGNLILSGETTCDRYAGYVHGAIMAGDRSAKLLVKEDYDTSIDTSNWCDDGPAV